MLRKVLLILGLALLVIGLVISIRNGFYGGMHFLVWGAILIIAVVFETWRYRRIEHLKGGQWQRTGESFQDPETGEPVDVLYDPASGERRYVKGKNHLQPPDG
jgi:hypothetical protein